MKHVKFTIYLGGLLALCFLFTNFAHAESVTDRDVSADAILLGDNTLAGMLPATGSQAAVAGGVLPTTGVIGANQAQDIQLEGISGSGLKDKKANVYDAKGDVKIRAKGAAEWNSAQIGMLVSEGDEILTGADGKVSVTFDANFANVTHIAENTKAEFRSIEPTDIFLMDGKIYNILDGLPKGASWKVSTPVAVSAVRGTWYLVSFQTSSGEFITATFDVPDDGTDSLVDVGSIVDGQVSPLVPVPEGKQLSLVEGETPDPSNLTKIDAKHLQQITDFLEQLGVYRAQNGELPPTGSEFLDLGPNDGGGDGNLLDPLVDTGAVEDGSDDLSSPPDEDPGGVEDCSFEECFGENEKEEGEDMIYEEGEQ